MTRRVTRSCRTLAVFCFRLLKSCQDEIWGLTFDSALSARAFFLEHLADTCIEGESSC